MSLFSYKLVNNNETLIEILNSELKFNILSPVQNTGNIATLFGGVLPIDYVTKYDGIFSFLIDFPNKETQDNAYAIYDILKNISLNENMNLKIYVKAMDIENAEYLELIQIKEISLLTGTTRLDKEDKIGTIIYFLYKNVN